MKLSDTDLAILSIIEDSNSILYSQSFSTFLTLELIEIEPDELGLEWSDLTFKGWWHVFVYRHNAH